MTYYQSPTTAVVISDWSVGLLAKGSGHVIDTINSLHFTQSASVQSKYSKYGWRWAQQAWTSKSNSIGHYIEIYEYMENLKTDVLLTFYFMDSCSGQPSSQHEHVYFFR